MYIVCHGNDMEELETTYSCLVTKLQLVITQTQTIIPFEQVEILEVK
jgi:hypothetical protein